MAQDTSWLDAMSTPVQNGKALPDGSVVFNLPPNPADVAEQQREAAKEERAQAEKTFRTMTVEEVAANGLPAGGVYQINGLGEIKTIQAPAKEEKGTVNKDVAARNVARQLSELRTIYNRSFAGTGPVQSISEFLPSNDRQKFQAIVRTMRADLKPLIRGPGEGTFTEGDQKLLDELLPDPDRFDAYNEQIFSEIENRVKGVLGEQAFAPAETRPNALKQPGMPATEVSGSGETYLTPEDLQLQQRLNSAYQAGATLEELRAISAEYNRPFPIGSQQELDAARKAGRSISVRPSGTRTAAMNAIGAVADTPIGAATVGASNAILSGLLDEIVPVLGGDPAVAQAAKEYLREKYPVSSFAGEVGGTVGQLAAGGAGLKAIGLGGKALAAAEIAQGAAYGAGESNDNRLLGAAIGGGSAVVGQQIANKLLNNPASRQAIEDVAAQTGQTAEVVAQEMGDALEAGAKRTAPDIAAPLTPEAQTEVGNLARQAIGRGKTAKDAQEKLAVMAQVDPEAKAAAENLGIELPVDVLSNDARLLTVTGLARSQIGSEAQTAWGQTVSQAIQQSDDTLRAIGATRDLAQVSESIRSRLLKDMGDLEEGANVLRREVDNAIDVQSRVDAQSLQKELAKTINDLGGIEEAKQAFSAEERKLFAMLGEGEQAKMPTYARLNQLRDQIGRALFKNQGPWVDAPTATLKRYYGALADDQINHIEAVAGREIADKMRGSNDLYSQMFKARESMKTVYGKSLEKDIGPLIKTAITSGSKGNAEALRKLIAAVPEDMQGQALLSGIFSLSERQSAGRGFSFAEYAKLYSGLRQNSPVYAEIAKVIGKDSEIILRDLYSISKRVAAAENKIIRTGASNQPLINALNAEGLVSKLAAGAVRRGAVTGGTALAGGVAGGPVGAVVGGGIADALQQTATQAGKSNLDKLHGVLASEPFKDLVEKVSTGAVKPADVNRAANDKPFRRFAATVLGIKDFDGRKNWLQSAATAGAVSQGTPEQQPTSAIEVR